MSLVKQIALRNREYMTGDKSVIGDEFDNVRDQANAALRGLGAWTSVPFVSGNFIAIGPMTWNVVQNQVTTFEFRDYGSNGTMNGGTLDLHLKVISSSVGGSSATAGLKLLIPNNRIVLNDAGGTYAFRDNGTRGIGLWEALAGQTYITFYRSDKSNWTGSVNATDVQASLTLSVQ